MIPYGRQSLDDDDIAAVTAVLKGDWLTQGPHIADFEDAIASFTGAGHAVAFCNGTAALHAAAIVAGLGPGDTVITSPLTFVASANCARYTGADVRFVDIDRSTLNADLSQLPSGADAIVAVHYAGLPVDLSRLSYRPRVVIEDAAHALGATTGDGPVGNCARSDLCVFSFHPVKALTTGEGGLVTTNSSALADRLRTVRNHGIVRKPEVAGWYYEVEDIGFNYRLTDIQAALGRSQLRRLPHFLSRRNEVARRYRERLAGLNLVLPPEPPPGWAHAYHLFPIRVQERAVVYERLHALNIGVQVHYVPVYRHPTYRQAGSPADFPATEDAYRSLLSLPIFPDLTVEHQDVVIAALEEAI